MLAWTWNAIPKANQKLQRQHDQVTKPNPNPRLAGTWELATCVDHFVTVEVSINIFSVSDWLAGDGDHMAANTVTPSRWYEDFFSIFWAAPLASEVASGRSQSPAASSLTPANLTSRRHKSPSLLFLLPPGLSLPTSARILPMIFPLPRVKSGLFWLHLQNLNDRQKQPVGPVFS